MSYQRVDPDSDMALMQQSGIGAYDHVGDWSFELFPYAYSFEAPADSRPIPPPILGGKGMGCGCGCGGGCSKNQGLGQGLFGTGLFESTNPLQWGIGEWATIGVGLYLASKVIGDAGSAAQTAKKTIKKHKSKATFGGGAVLGLALAGGAAYVIYQLTQSQTSTTAAAAQ